MSRLFLVIFLSFGCLCASAPAPDVEEGNSKIDSIYEICNKHPESCLGAGYNNTDGGECIGQKNCTVLTVHETTADNKHKYYALVSDSYEYVSIAFSTDKKMGDDSAVVCLEDEGSIDVYLAYIEGHHVNRLKSNEGLTVMDKEITGGFILCSFALENRVDFTNTVLSLAEDVDYYLFLAYGEEKDDELEHHEGWVMSDDYFVKKNLMNFAYNLCVNNENCLATYHNNTDAGDCIQDRPCTVLTVHEMTSDNKHKFHTILNSTYEYAALAFSEDLSMGDDGTIEILLDEKDGVQLNLAYLGHRNITQIDSTEGLQLVENYSEGGFIYCSYVVDNFVDFGEVNVSLAGDKQYHIFLAYGHLKTDGSIGHHTGWVRSDEVYFYNEEYACKKALYDECQVDVNREKCVGGYVHTKQTTSTRDDEPDCITKRDCHFLSVYNHTDSDVHQFQLLSSLKDGYMAVAFSQDNKMGGDSEDGVIECINVDLKSLALQKAIIPADSHEVKKVSNLDNVKAGQMKIFDNNMYCQFNLNDDVKYETMTVSLDGSKEYYLLLATGTVQRNSSGYIIDISEHTGTAVSDKPLFKSSAMVTLAASMVWYFLLSIVLSATR